MYVKVISKEKADYYILCVKDSKKDVWVEHFISEEIARCLMQQNVKMIYR